MASTYEAIASQTLGSNTASVTFSSIPGTYTDLVLVIATSGDDASPQNIVMQFNADTSGGGSNYSYTTLWGTGSTAGSARSSNRADIYLDYYSAIASGSPSTHVAHIMSYANTNVFKTVLSCGARAASGVDRNVGLWRSTAAITDIKVASILGMEFASGGTFSLFGVKAA